MQPTCEFDSLKKDKWVKRSFGLYAHKMDENRSHLQVKRRLAMQGLFEALQRLRLPLDRDY